MKAAFAKQEIVYLETLGFRPTFPDAGDPGYCLYELSIKKHRLLNSLCITVDHETIIVWCTDLITNQPAGVVSKPFSKRTLQGIISNILKP